MLKTSRPSPMVWSAMIGRLLAVALLLCLYAGASSWSSHRSADDGGNAAGITGDGGGKVLIGPDAPSPTTTGEPVVASKGVDVAGNTAWTDTGVACRSGGSVQLVASGTVFHDPTSGVGPEGDPNPDLRRFNLPGLADVNHSALVARVGSTSAPTVVGSEVTYDCETSGELYLGPNDVGVDNNHGAWTVTVTPSD